MTGGGPKLTIDEELSKYKEDAAEITKKTGASSLEDLQNDTSAKAQHLKAVGRCSATNMRLMIAYNQALTLDIPGDHITAGAAGAQGDARHAHEHLSGASNGY